MVARVHGEFGGSLTFEIEEEVHEQLIEGPDGLGAWRQGDAFHLIPPEEESSRARYESDPERRNRRVGQFRQGIHFGEINTMRLLRDDGFSDWLYEVFVLFGALPADDSSSTWVRTLRARAALGDQTWHRLRDAGNLYGHGVTPCIPDLMAWRQRDGFREFRFIESKNQRGRYKEKVKEGQLLGLALLALLVPNSEVSIYRWLSADEYRDRLRTGRLRGQIHRRTFEPRGNA
jgi:hypothetical protein